MPFSTTTESLARHFRAAKPSAVRVRTNKGTGRCRGFAFLEFSSKDALQACLRRYHHSQVRDEDALKDGQAKDAATSGQVGEEAAGEAEGAGAKAGKSTKGWRRINVELTYADPSPMIRLAAGAPGRLRALLLFSDAASGLVEVATRARVARSG